VVSLTLTKCPYAKGRTFVNPYSAFKFYEQYGFPLVIKPNVGGFSRGAYFPIEFWNCSDIVIFFVFILF
jgi:hypothetical protein